VNNGKRWGGVDCMPIDISGFTEILYDIKNGGTKEVAWQLHHLITLRLAQAYKRLESPKYQRIVNCAGYMEFRRYEDNSMKLHTANFCQTRLCPTCNWRRSYKMFAQVSKIMGSISNDYEFVFLSLTCKNVSGEYLDRQLNILFSAYKALCLRKRFKAAVRGWYRTLEITYNWESREFHPHFHCILAVDKTYFTSPLYIQQDEFCRMWQDCLKVDYKPIVDIRVFTESEKGKGKEVAEVAKYTIKSSNIMANLQDVSQFSEAIQEEARKVTDRITDEIVSVLDSALTNRRLIGYGGIFKTKHKELNLDDEIDGDLIHTNDEGVSSGVDYQIERYGWHIGYRNYVRLADCIAAEESGESGHEHSNDYKH
jgi:plasmid rolling circle replication initiator protein Rep